MASVTGELNFKLKWAHVTVATILDSTVIEGWENVCMCEKQ